QKQIRKTQADVYIVSIDLGVRTPFIWYSSTKGVGKIEEHDIEYIFCLCKHIDDLISKKNGLASSISKRKKKKALHVDKAIFHMQ
ncbi:7542_t:CDS:1, partial [Cetraspora pellucida]